MREIEAAETIRFRLNDWSGWLLGFSLVSTVCVLGWLLKYSSYGFDFTDESFYLVWIANPFDYKWGYTQFGFIYHPLYQFMNGNISALRQVNILLTFGLASVMVYRFLKVIIPESPPNTFQRWILSMAFATASLVVFDSWLLTPSYNSLALQAMFIVVTGLLMAERKLSVLSVWGWVLIGFGGWLSFMAKPTTGVALGGCSLVYLVGTQKMKWRWLLISVGSATVLLILTALVVDGSLVQYLDRLKTGGQFARDQDAGYTLRQIFRLDRPRLLGIEMLFLTSMGVLSFFSARVIGSGVRWKTIIGQVIPVAFFVSILVILFRGEVVSLRFGRFHNLTLWAIPLSVVAVGIVSYGRGLFFNVPKRERVMVLLFILFPHVYAFGSNNNYFYKGSSASLFWVLAGFIFIGPLVRNKKNWMVILSWALATQLIVTLLLQIGFVSPYRQVGAIPLNGHSVEVGQPGSSLFLSEGYATYVKEAVDLARRAGFEERTPVIDLTGQSPGILYVMRAENIGQPWTIGGYSGSLKIATNALRLVSCEKIAKAWVLTEPGGPRSIPHELLGEFGADLSEDYEEAAVWETPRGAGGYEERPLQILLKPQRAIARAIQACHDQKAKQQHE
jgi:hypothetical protein